MPEATEISRRRILTGLALGGLAVTSGCSASQAGDGEQSVSGKEMPWPKSNAATDERWSRVRQDRAFQENAVILGSDVESYIRTNIYENAALRQQVREKTLGQFDQTLATFFASRIELRGLFTAGATPSKVADSAEQQLKSQMDKQGIKNVRKVAPNSPAPASAESTAVREFRGTFRTPKITKTVDIPDVGRRELEISSGSLPITGLLAAWKQDTATAFVAGGAFPAADYEVADTLSVTGGKTGDGIDLTVSIDLNLNPEEIRRSVVTLAESVH